MKLELKRSPSVNFENYHCPPAFATCFLRVSFQWQEVYKQGSLYNVATTLDCISDACAVRHFNTAEVKISQRPRFVDLSFDAIINQSINQRSGDVFESYSSSSDLKTVQYTPQRQEIFLFSIKSRSALWPIQPPTEWVSVLFPGGKATGA